MRVTFTWTTQVTRTYQDTVDLGEVDVDAAQVRALMADGRSLWEAIDELSGDLGVADDHLAQRETGDNATWGRTDMRNVDRVEEVLQR